MRDQFLYSDNSCYFGCFALGGLIFLNYLVWTFQSLIEHDLCSFFMSILGV